MPDIVPVNGRITPKDCDQELIALRTNNKVNAAFFSMAEIEFDSKENPFATQFNLKNLLFYSVIAAYIHAPKFFPMPKSPKEMYEAIVKNLEKKTGKSLDEWQELVKKKGPKDRKEKKEWLQIKYGLGGGQAGTIVKMMYEGLDDYDESELMKKHFANGKEYLKPVYDKLLTQLKKLGKVKVSVNKTYLSLANKEQFALLKTTSNGLVVGVPGTAVRQAKSKEFVPAKNLGSDKITHKITLVDETDLTDGLMKVLKTSYQKY